MGKADLEQHWPNEVDVPAKVGGGVLEISGRACPVNMHVY